MDRGGEQSPFGRRVVGKGAVVVHIKYIEMSVERGERKGDGDAAIALVRDAVPVRVPIRSAVRLGRILVEERGGLGRSRCKAHIHLLHTAVLIISTRPSPQS